MTVDLRKWLIDPPGGQSIQGRGEHLDEIRTDQGSMAQKGLYFSSRVEKGRQRYGFCLFKKCEETTEKNTEVNKVQSKLQNFSTFCLEM